MKLYQPDLIYVEKRARKWPLTQAILNRLPHIPAREIEDIRPEIEAVKQLPDPVSAGKRTLFLAYDLGRSFKPFPESEQYLSCDYYTLHLAEGCDLECSYCILQAYLTNPFLTVYVNVDETLEKLGRILDENPDRFFRIGTGQLADSLSLDHLTGFSETLVPFFAGRRNAVLELKTKSDNTGRLFGLQSRGKTIVSWSMNSQEIQEREEHKTAGLEERLAAARALCRETDFRVGFHFDPIIDTPDWEKNYQPVLEDLFSQIPHERIAWISLGCLRFTPPLKPIMENRFPKSPLPYAEWVRGMDGKMRYFKPRRIQIYQSMVQKIRVLAPDVTLYLSMETPEVWEEVFGQRPTKESVCRLLDQAALRQTKSGKKRASMSPAGMPEARRQPSARK